LSPPHRMTVSRFRNDQGMRVRLKAARAIAIMGRDAKSAIKDLIEALADKEPDVLVWVCISLGEMREAGQEALPKLEGLVDHQDPRVKQAAADAIGRIKAKARN